MLYLSIGIVSFLIIIGLMIVSFTRDQKVRKSDDPIAKLEAQWKKIIAGISDDPNQSMLKAEELFVSHVETVVGPHQKTQDRLKALEDVLVDVSAITRAHAVCHAIRKNQTDKITGDDLKESLKAFRSASLEIAG